MAASTSCAEFKGDGGHGSLESSSRFHLVSRLNLLLRDLKEMIAMMERDGAAGSEGDWAWGGTV
jgi:hypothetical protein